VSDLMNSAVNKVRRSIFSYYIRLSRGISNAHNKGLAKLDELYVYIYMKFMLTCERLRNTVHHPAEK
jgi:hypothetical protein